MTRKVKALAIKVTRTIKLWLHLTALAAGGEGGSELKWLSKKIRLR